MDIKAKSIYSEIKRLEEEEEEVNNTNTADPGEKNVKRRHLGKLYREIATEISYSLGQKYGLEERCWKHAIYPAISEFRRKSYSEFSTSGSSSYEDDMAVLLEHLNWAVKFYIDWMTALVRKHSNSSSSSSSKGISEAPLSAREKDLLRTFNRLFNYLGDISRYISSSSSSSSSDLSECIQMYEKSISFAPTNGKCWHQLGLARKLSDADFEAFYCYIRSLSLSQPYTSSRESIMMLLENNRRLYVSSSDKSDIGFPNEMLFYVGCLWGKIGLSEKIIRIMSSSLNNNEYFFADNILWKLTICILHCLNQSQLLTLEQLAVAVYLLNWIIRTGLEKISDSEASFILLCIMGSSCGNCESISKVEDIWTVIFLSDGYLTGCNIKDWNLFEFFGAFHGHCQRLLQCQVEALDDFDVFAIMTRGIPWIKLKVETFNSWDRLLLRDITEKVPCIPSKMTSSLKSRLSDAFSKVPFNKEGDHLNRSYLEEQLLVIGVRLRLSHIDSENVVDEEVDEEGNGNELISDDDEEEQQEEEVPEDMKQLLDRKNRLQKDLKTSGKSTRIKELLPDTMVIFDTNEWMSHSFTIKRLFLQEKRLSSIGIINVVWTELLGLFQNTEGKKEIAGKALKTVYEMYTGEGSSTLRFFDGYGKPLENPEALFQSLMSQSQPKQEWKDIFRKMGKTTGVNSLDDVLLHACAALHESWKTPIVFVTSDRNLRVKAGVDGIPCLSWHHLQSLLR